MIGATVLAREAGLGEQDTALQALADHAAHTSADLPPTRRVAVRVPFHDHEVRVVQQPVHRGRGHQFVEEERIPLFDGTVRGEDRRAALVALPDDFVDVDRLFSVERSQAEIIDDQEIRRREAQ